MSSILPFTYGGDNLLLVTQYKISATKNISVNTGGKRQIIRGSYFNFKSKRRRDDQDANQWLIQRIKDRLKKIDLSVSSYDTAWVAMVPSSKGLPDHQQTQPCFPGCLEWVRENQKSDGSWGLDPGVNPSLVKDSLSSTLACILALQKWGAGEQLVQRGLDFIGSNKFALRDDNQISPMGFDIVFPGMICYAQDLGLNLPLDSAFLDHARQIQSLNAKNCHLGYFAEGLGQSYEWEKLLKKEQRSNGSLFNSPASTAAAFINLQDDKCFHYLKSLVQFHGNAVPTIYPYRIYSLLCTVDALERLGIARYFKREIDIVLDETYRCWKERDEEIFLNAACCALAFRLLRTYGYKDIASNLLGDFVDQEHLMNTENPESSSIYTIIELYRASEIKILEKEPVLDNIRIWTNTFLQTQLSKEEINSNGQLLKEVQYALDYSIHSLDRLAHRRGIELYDVNRFRMLKTSYRCSNTENKDILEFSIRDYNSCQATFNEELVQLEKWVRNSRLVSLKFDWHTLVSAYFVISAVHFSPEQADARLTFFKACFLGNPIDDMFDIDGSKDELLNIIELVEKWDDNPTVGYCSERIEILFSAIQESVDHDVTRAHITQGRCIKSELHKLWVDFVKSSLKEVDWVENKSIPRMEEYLTNGFETIGVGLFTIAFYFLGVEFQQDIVTTQEYKSLYKNAGTIQRLFNDYQGLERDRAQRKMNSCWLLMQYSNGALTEEEARAEVRKMIEKSERELLQMVLQKEGSLIPNAIKQSFFNISKIAHYVYNIGDEYRSPSKTVEDIKVFFTRPLELPISNKKQK